MKKRSKPEKQQQDIDDDFVDGDTFYESAIDNRKAGRIEAGSDSESIEEHPDVLKLRQGKAYLEKIMQTDSDESEESEEEGDKITSRLAADAVRTMVQLLHIQLIPSPIACTLANLVRRCAWKVRATGRMPQREMADKVRLWVQ